MSFMSIMENALSKVSDIANPKSEIEKKLAEVLSKANYGAPSSMLREIAAATHDYLEYPIIMRETWDSLNHAGKNWRQIYKGLVLLEYLVKVRTEEKETVRQHTPRQASSFSGAHSPLLLSKPAQAIGCGTCSFCIPQSPGHYASNS